MTIPIKRRDPGLGEFEETDKISIEHGGTNANSLLEAQDNLGISTKAEQVDLNALQTDLENLSDEVETKADAAAVNQALSLKADLVDGVIPAAQLPSFVDDVLNGTYIDDETFNDENDDPYPPEDGKIYVDTTSNKTYRWSGSIYVEIGGGGVALGETAATAYRGDRGKAAYDHSISQGNPHNATTSDIPEGNKLYFTEDRVLQAALIGLNTTNPAPVTATDALLAAIGKLQAQINNSNSSGFNWVNATAISGFSFRSGVGTHSPQPLKFAIKDGLLWMSGSVYAISLDTAFDIFALTNSNYQLEQPTTTYTVTLSYFPAFYVKTGDYIESQIDFKLTKQGSTLRLLPTSSLSTSSGVFLIVFKTMCIGRLVS